jgi:hypothetical protein
MKRVSLFIALFVALSSQVAWGQPPRLISYQGVLKDAGGQVMPDGTYTFFFTLYEAQVGGAALWDETQQQVEVRKGIFNVILGSVNPLTLPFDKQYWLGVRVNTSNELPRVQLTSSPYSLSTRYATFVTPFLTIDGQPSPSIAFKEGSGTLSITVSTSIKCRIIVYAYQEANSSSWFNTQLLESIGGGTTEVARDYHLSSHGDELDTNVLIYARTLSPEDGTATYTSQTARGLGGDGIRKNRFVVHAVPIE